MEKYPNAEVERIVETLMRRFGETAQCGFPPSAESVRATLVYIYQLGRFDGRIAGIKEMAQ
jgi:hypothetical protein